MGLPGQSKPAVGSLQSQGKEELTEYPRKGRENPGLQPHWLVEYSYKVLFFTHNVYTENQGGQCGSAVEYVSVLLRGLVCCSQDLFPAPVDAVHFL